MRAREVGNSVHAGEGHGRAQGKVHPEALTQSLPLPGGAWYPQQPHLRPPPHPHTSSSCFGLLFRILKPEKGQAGEAGGAATEPLAPAGWGGGERAELPCGAGALWGWCWGCLWSVCVLSCIPATFTWHSAPLCGTASTQTHNTKLTVKPVPQLTKLVTLDE